MKLTGFEVLKRWKHCENIGEFRLFTTKNMSRFVEISSATTAHYICVYNKQIIPWVAGVYHFYSLVWNICLTRSLRSLVRFAHSFAMLTRSVHSLVRYAHLFGMLTRSVCSLVRYAHSFGTITRSLRSLVRYARSFVKCSKLVNKNDMRAQPMQ